MPIKVGDRLPDTKFRVMTTEGPVWKTTDEVFKGRKVALFAVPGAFTPTCNNLHIPSFLNNAAAIKALADATSAKPCPPVDPASGPANGRASDRQNR